MAVPVIIKCSSCDTRLQLDEKHLGKKVRCPNCSAGIAVPTHEEYVSSGMAAKAIALSGKRFALDGIAKATQQLADDADATEGELSDLPQVMDWRDEVREIFGSWQAWVPAVGLHLLVILILGVWYVAGDANSSLTIRPPEPPPNPDEPFEPPPPEVLDEPPGNETEMLFDLAFDGPKNEQEADDARLEDEVRVNSPIEIIAANTDSQFAYRAKRGMPSGNGPGRGNFMKVSYEAAGVVFVLDKSSSMSSEDGRLTFSKDELKRTLKKLPNWMRFNVVYFSHPESEPPGYVVLNDTPVHATASNKQRAYNFVDNIEPSGSTNPYPALKLATSFENIDLVFMLSDGVFFLSETEIDVIVEQCKKNGIRINGIAFKDDGGEMILKRLSGGTGGRYKFVP